MIHHELRGLRVVQSALLLEEGVPHGWFDATLGNLQFRPDNPFHDPEWVPEAVIEARRARACGAVGLDYRRLVRTSGLLQTDIVQQLHREHEGLTAGKADGYLTDVPGQAVVVNAADCLQMGIFDPRNRVLAVVHAGGLGTSRAIVPKAISMMQDRFHTNPKDLKVAIGPSLAGRYFTPSLAVDGFDLAGIAASHPAITQAANGEQGYDVAGTTLQQLLELGVLASRIEIDTTDTYTDPNCYSWERDRQTDPAASMRRQGFFIGIPETS